MKISEAEALVRRRCAEVKHSPKTGEAYAGVVRRYSRWLLTHPLGSNEERVRAYLNDLAPRAAVSSWKVAVNGLVFFYAQALQTPLGELGEMLRAQRPKRLPVWVTFAEFEALARHLDGALLEIAQLMFGSGLRLHEALRLRVQHLDFETGLILVKGGKGDKDRPTCFPKTLMPSLRERLRRLQDLWSLDRSNHVPGVWLPEDVGRKFPNYGKDWPWQWVFPARGLSRDKASGITRRHHLHPDTLAKALKRAAVACGLRKRITAHSLRHGFATQFLTNGGSVHQLKELLGHTHLETTEIYTHCIPQFAATVVSPLDVRTNVVPFSEPSAEPTLRRFQA